MANMNITSYVLSLLFDSEVTMKEVQKRLRHSLIKTTMDVYTPETKQSD